PLTVAVLASLEVRARHLGVRAGQPGGMGAGRGGQADVAALVGSALDDPVEHAEVVPVLGRLNQSPVEDAEGDGVDPGGVKELIVPGPDLLGPLLRVVVPAECDLRGGGQAHAVNSSVTSAIIGRQLRSRIAANPAPSSASTASEATATRATAQIRRQRLPSVTALVRPRK